MDEELLALHWQNGTLHGCIIMYESCGGNFDRALLHAGGGASE